MIVCIVIIEMLVVLSAFAMKGCSKIVFMLSGKMVVQNNQTQYININPGTLYKISLENSDNKLIR